MFFAPYISAMCLPDVQKCFVTRSNVVSDRFWLVTLYIRNVLKVCGNNICKVLNLLEIQFKCTK